MATIRLGVCSSSAARAPSRVPRLLSWGHRFLRSIVCGSLAPYGLDAPPTTFEGPWGLRVYPPSPRTLPREVHPPVDFDPPPEFDGNEPLPRGAAPSLRFRASPRHPLRGSARRGRCHPAAAFRPQVFSTSRRLAPHEGSRACFIPQARPGLPLQGLLLPRSRTASRRPLPSCRCRRRASEETRHPLVFRALLPSRIRSPPDAGEGAGGAMPSWVSPRQGFSLPRPQATLPPPSPHVLGRPPYGTDVRLHLRVSAHRWHGSSLARPPTLRGSRPRRTAHPFEATTGPGSWFHREDETASPRSRALT